MDPTKRRFQPDTVQLSKLHFYSKGFVAENKALKSMVIEVTPIEEMTLLDGELSAQTVSVSSQGQDVNGTSYATSVKTGNTVQATWLKIGVGNRMTAPDVRRGAPVILYQFGDSDTFYWTTLQDDSQLRKLETVIYGFSGTAVEGDDSTSHDNMYYFEISTHTGLITLHTSKAHGEFTTYDFQLNTKTGQFVVRDGIGNWGMLDSKAHQWHLENVDGSLFDMTKTTARLYTKDTIDIETTTLTVKAKTGNYNVDTMNITGTTLAIKETTTTLTSPTYSLSGTSMSINYSTMTSTGTYASTGSSFQVTAPVIRIG